MFLFRLAFWLTIVVWNLPRLDPQPPVVKERGRLNPPKTVESCRFFVMCSA